MIADIYKCPKCGCNVYLAQDETYCPLCAEKQRDEMELVELGVDLEQDAALGEPRYANFDHLLEILLYQFGNEVLNYALDCWSYAWDATKCDLTNANNINSFLDNPNGFVLKERATPMSKQEFHNEIERIINILLSKCKFPRDFFEKAERFESHVRTQPKFRLFVKNDLTNVSADVCNKYTPMTDVCIYTPLERHKPTPKINDGFYLFEGILCTDTHTEKEFKNTAQQIADYVTKKCFPDTKVSRILNQFTIGFDNPTFSIKLVEKKRRTFFQRLFNIPESLCENLN